MIPEVDRNSAGKVVAVPIAWPISERRQRARSLALPDEWRIALGCALALFLGFGIVYSMPIFHIARRAEFGGSAGDLGVVFSAAGCLYYALGPVSGRLADRLGAPLVVFAGMLAIALGLFAGSIAQSNFGFDFAYAAGLGFGMGLVFVPSLGAVQRYCASWRASATGFASLGLGLSAFAAPPATAILIEMLGPTAAMRAMGLIAAGGSACALLLRPVGPPTPSSRRPNENGPTGPKRVMRSRAFVELYASSLCFAVAAFVPFAHLPSIADHLGWSPRDGALLVCAIGLGSTGSRLGLGCAVRNLGARRSLAYAGLTLAIGLSLAAVARRFPALLVAALVIGVGYGGGTAVLPPLVAETFGTARIGEIVGDLFTARSIGILAGPALTGLTYDLLGDFAVPFFLCAVLSLLSMVWLMPLRRRQQLPAFGGEPFVVRSDSNGTALGDEHEKAI